MRPHLPTLPTRLLLLVGCILALPFACTAPQAQAANAIAVDLTNAICSPADPLDTSPVVDVVCALATTTEGIVGGLQAKSVTLQVAREGLPAFLAAHGVEAARARAAAKVSR
ncbi:MAG TPA: hypothetical protein VKR78_07575 [Acidimicrobiales bacterium]|nr:hypothetical protein [Acidimicrobiales bacterium]